MGLKVLLIWPMKCVKPRRKGKTTMSQKILKNLNALCEAEERNQHVVEQRLRSKGIYDAKYIGLVASIAKYYEALEKLSAE